MDKDITYDALVIGSGASGLSLALRLADHARVAVLSKVALSEGNTRYAQGGISAVLDAQDSLESHIEDTLAAGAGLCDPEIVRLVVSQGKECIDWLLQHGVAFTEVESTDGAHHLHLTREGGHTHRRVVHAADATGRAVESSLEQHARAHPNIDLFEHHNVIDLITSHKLGLAGPRRVLGAYALDTRSHRTRTFRARVIALATGGASKVYLYTSNPDVSTGDGIALAWRAGARVANMEFIQFHPTCLYHPHARSFLISEAVRGEGGRLLLPDGSPFMQRFDPRGELAPRDIVARAIDHEMKRLGADCVYLDISHRPADFIRSHFPTIHARCLELGMDITREPIPVVPAAHYTCGGVVTDRLARTDIDGLYAVGEVACTGLHGANRMASNSLLECLVFAKQASQDILRRLRDIPPPSPLPEWDESQVTDSDEEVVVSHNWDEIRRFMWDYVGIVRTDKRLQRALHRAELLKQEIAEYYGNFRVTSDLLELRNLVIVAELIIRSALQRKESRGLHFTLDYPERDEAHPPRNTVLEP
ncbi:L-aspartate oxidase [Methylococcus sp. ANG]|uniref:L-aspartate oxidase n=1 Tax=unclassified Methylococcus TaxID=2618889 RepID=UPI001C52C385|nr:L-aspartate oxidase [Methylococcus sp. Mc7]QXP86180.1 L-aspartate oxidase [Methylococcus sp. Mc7]